MQNQFQTNSGEYSAFSLGWQSYFPEYLKQQMVIFQPTPWIVGQHCQKLIFIIWVLSHKQQSLMSLSKQLRVFSSGNTDLHPCPPPRFY